VKFRILPQGRRVIVWRGPAKTTYTFADEEEALDFAERTEAELLGDAAERMARLKTYADPGHPADPVLPHPAEFARAQAELAALTEGGEPPPPMPSATELVDDGEALREQARAAILGGGADPGLVTVRLEWDPDRDRVAAAILNEGEESVTVHREVLSAEGRVVRKGDLTIGPGREISRQFALTEGQSIRFHAAGVDLAEFAPETNIGGDPAE
jgi:hypothetical protein